MEKQLHLEMLPQPDDFTCGAPCPHAIYSYHNDELPLEQIVRDVRHLDEGGTLGVFSCELIRGYLKRSIPLITGPLSTRVVLVGAIMPGALTCDANLLVIEPREFAHA
jgi:hypothetical protein